jgi:hypothetical protein
MFPKWLDPHDDLLQRWDVGLAMVFGMIVGAVLFQYICHRLRRWWDRRMSLRKWGNPTAVSIIAAAGGKGDLDGTIWNRSDGGLGVLVDQAFAPGDQLMIRAKEAPPQIPWVRAEVRHCQPLRKSWMIGCKFQEVVHWETWVWFD